VYAAEYIVYVSWPALARAGKHVFETLEELRMWLQTFLRRYGKKSREKHIEGILESIRKRGYVGMTATGWYGFKIETAS